MILASADISVKGVLPEVTLCPFCHHESLSIYMDPIIGESSRWLHCGICGFRGDTLETLAKLRHSENLYEAINVGLREGLCDTTSGTFDADTIDGYIRHYPERRNEINNAWDKFRSTISDRPSPDMVKRIQDENLWGGWLNNSQDRLTRFVGGGMRREVNRELQKLFFVRNKQLPQHGYRTNLILGYQDTPGRICAFEFLGETERRIATIAHGNNNDADEGGLGMLEALMPFESKVFAVGDPTMALQLHRRHFSTFRDPLKVILFNQKTKRSWQSVHADKVILWNNGIDWKIFDHARCIPNHRKTVYVAALPNISKEIWQYMSNEPLSVVLERMENYALPWPEAFVRWITDKDMPSATVHAAIAKLGFDASERRLLFDRCPRELKPRLDHYMSEDSSVQSVFIGNKNVVEHEDGWYVTHSLRGNELISDATVRVFKEISDPERGKVFWEGEIRYKGRAVEFTDDIENIERDSLKWLRERMTRAGLGMPMFQHTWKLHFIHMAKIFSAPKPVTISSKVGPRKDGSIVFPRFRLENGCVADKQEMVNMEGIPALRVSPPELRPKIEGDKGSYVKATYAAISAAVISNWLKSMRGSVIAPIALVGSVQSSACVVGRRFAKNAGMNMFVVSDPKYRRRELVTVREQLRDDYPSYIESISAGLLQHYPTANTDLVILAVEPSEAAALATGGNWIFVHAPKMPDEDVIPPFDDFLLYLMDLQKRDYDLPGGDCTVGLVLDDFAAWYSTTMGFPKAELDNNLKGMLRLPLHAGDQMLALAFSLHREDLLPAEHQPFVESLEKHGTIGASRFGILIDDERDKVFISLPTMKKVIDRARYPMPDFAEVSRDLAARGLLLETDYPGDGWVVDKSYWEAQVRGWRHNKL